MNGYRLGFNSGLFQATSRMDIMSTKVGVHPATLFSIDKRIWISGLDHRQLATLDKIPVSVLRFRFTQNQLPDLMPNDSDFIRAALNVASVSEAINYINTCDYDPLLITGVKHKNYEWFTQLKYRRRIRICDSPGFHIVMPVNPARLILDPSKESALHNTCQILGRDLHEFERLSKNESYDGTMEDYGVLPHETHAQMRCMIERGIRPMIASALTGMDLLEVSNYARSNSVRKLLPRQAIKGRIPSVEVSFTRSPQQANLFMLCYTLIGKGTRQATNSKAALYAYDQTQRFLTHMGFPDDQIININDAFNVAMGTLSGELMWRSCQKCGAREVFLPTKETPCIWCSP